MKLIVLGSGTSVPHPKRASAAYWLETRSGTLLLDASADAMHRMAQEQLNWPNLDAIWISHFHLDHLGGLAPFLFGTKGSPQTQNRRKPLYVYGPRGLENIFKAIDQSNDYGLFKQPFPIGVVEVEPDGEFGILPAIAAKTFSTPHTKESLAIRLIEEGGSSLVYTSDTGYSEELILFARVANVLLMECSFHRDKPIKTHLDLAEAMEVARKCNPQKVVLSHLYPEWDPIDLAAEAKLLWPGQTIEAFDGLRFEF